MRRIVILLCTAVLLIPMFVIPVSCTDNIELYPENLVFDDDFYNMLKEKQQLLLNHFYGNISIKGVSKAGFNLFCLFGHDIKYGMAIVTHHNMYPTSPKCLLQNYEYEACMRSGCDYYKVEFLHSIPLTCHP